MTKLLQQCFLFFIVVVILGHNLGNSQVSVNRTIGPTLVYFLFYRFFLQQVRVEGRNKNKNKIHSDHFPIELKSKETQFRVSFDFNSIGKRSE